MSDKGRKRGEGGEGDVEKLKNFVFGGKSHIQFSETGKRMTTLIGREALSEKPVDLQENHLQEVF